MNQSLKRTDPTILIVVGQVLGKPWLDIASRGQLHTWIPDAESLGLQVRHSFGVPPGVLLRRVDALHEWARWTHWGRRAIPRLDRAWGSLLMDWNQKITVDQFVEPGQVGWRQTLPDLYMFQRWKVLGSLRQSLHEEYDFIYFTTASSYVRPRALLDFASSLPRTMVYAGTRIIDHDTQVEFGSGANRLLSRDVVNQLIENSHVFQTDVMEDVGLGRALQHLGIELTPSPSLNIESLSVLEALSDATLTEHFHFRLKSGTRKQRDDVELMHALHRRLAPSG